MLAELIFYRAHLLGFSWKTKTKKKKKKPQTYRFQLRTPPDLVKIQNWEQIWIVILPTFKGDEGQLWQNVKGGKKIFLSFFSP